MKKLAWYTATFCLLLVAASWMITSPSVGQSVGLPASVFDTVSKALKVTQATTTAGEDVLNDVQKVEQRFSYVNITLAAPTTTVVKSSPGFLHMATFNKPVSTGTLTCYDNTAASGNIIATITSPAGGVPVTVTYDVSFLVGLTCVTATAAQDITLSYR